MTACRPPARGSGAAQHAQRRRSGAQRPGGHQRVEFPLRQRPPVSARAASSSTRAWSPTSSSWVRRQVSLVPEPVRLQASESGGHLGQLRGPLLGPPGGLRGDAWSRPAAPRSTRIGTPVHPDRRWSAPPPPGRPPPGRRPTRCRTRRRRGAHLDGREAGVLQQPAEVRPGEEPQMGGVQQAEIPVRKAAEQQRHPDVAVRDVRDRDDDVAAGRQQ